ncbi:hypothetical protein CASFOL_031070 [Castilleja foliolosa]|uniref:Uncharacterized protein n=1 Tax=Castilleja foliolosa TaxID=1961234 RepID=A0ABD3C4C3_9LAMI
MVVAMAVNGGALDGIWKGGGETAEQIPTEDVGPPPPQIGGGGSSNGSSEDEFVSLGSSILRVRAGFVPNYQLLELHPINRGSQSDVVVGCRHRLMGAEGGVSRVFVVRLAETRRFPAGPRTTVALGHCPPVVVCRPEKL